MTKGRMSQVLRKIAKLFMVGSMVWLFPANPMAQAEIVRSAHVEAELIAEVSSVKLGEPFWVALRMKMDPEWHVYWRNPGDSGLATHFEWSLPEGWQVGEIQWPYPKTINMPPLTTYAYEGETLLMTQVTPIKQAGEVKLKARWLTCKIECVPGQGEFSLNLPVSKGTPEANSKWVTRFAQARSRLPLEQTDWKLTAHRTHEYFILELEPKKPTVIKDLYFYPFEDSLLEHSAEQILQKTWKGYELKLTRSTRDTQKVKQIEGVLVTTSGWRGQDSENAWHISVPMDTFEFTLPLALLFALIGGLILNLMPCVLPVLSIKILNLVGQSGQSRWLSFKHGLQYSLGVMVSFWVLAGFLFVFRAGGAQIGWGFQLQSPAFICALMLLFITLTVMMLGYFELRFSLPAFKTSSHFLSGVLATVVATPCTAPFMGTALGYALTQNASIGFLVFSALGFGMAFPYILLSTFPNLLRFIPKPGPWMVHFKRGLAVLLFATVVWLGWVLSQQLSPAKESTVEETVGGMTWEFYSAERLETLKAEGKPIFLDFTAAWCLTCKVNERVALRHPKVVKRFEKLDVVLVKADWTTRDPEITKALASYGRSSIPLYVYYPGNGQEPILLPEILTPDILLNTLE